MSSSSALSALLIFLAHLSTTTVSAFSSLSSPQPTPTTPPTTTALTLPYPYTYAHVALTTDTLGSPLASFSAYSQLPCGRRPDWLGTTTIDVQIPCLGASQLSTTIGRGGACPMGGKGRTRDPLISNTKTGFRFICSPTPDPSPNVKGVPTDWSAKFRAPTLPPGFSPEYTPAYITAASYAEGWCYQSVWLAPADEGVSRRMCEGCATCVSPTRFAGTVTSTVGVECGEWRRRGCTFMPLETGGVPTRCPSIGEEDRGATVTVGSTRTTWKYECTPTQTP